MWIKELEYVNNSEGLSADIVHMHRWGWSIIFCDGTLSLYNANTGVYRSMSIAGSMCLSQCNGLIEGEV